MWIGADCAATTHSSRLGTRLLDPQWTWIISVSPSFEKRQTLVAPNSCTSMSLRKCSLLGESLTYEATWNANSCTVVPNHLLLSMSKHSVALAVSTRTTFQSTLASRFFWKHRLHFFEKSLYIYESSKVYVCLYIYMNLALVSIDSMVRARI